jgi:DNA-binding CsgD family transcriptional regulator
MLLARSHLIPNLVRLVRTCVSPFDHGDVDEWRRAVAGGLNDALGGVLAQVSLAPLDGAARMVGVNIDQSVFDEYVRDWMDRDPLYQALDGRTRYTGSGLVHSAPGFRDAYRAAAIYPDFFDKHRIRDTAAILHAGPPFLQLAVFTERFGDRLFMECAQPMLDVVEPAFVQGARALLAHRGIVRSFVRQIDESQTATALYSLRGILLHRNVALNHLLRSAPARVRLETHMRALVRDAQGLAGIAATARLEELMRSATTLHRQSGAYRLELVLAERGLGGSPPLLLLIVRTDGTRDGPLAQLSRREREVAELIAAGVPTRSIAERLSISTHTVRRHTERIFSKLGVRTRLQVAALVHRH